MLSCQKEAVNASAPGLEVMIVGEDQVSHGGIFVIDGKDAAPSLLASSLHRDSIKMLD